MSIGTIVTIVLLVSVLILGLVLIQNIFKSGKKVVDLTDTQLTEEINKLFGSEDKVVMFPGSRQVEIEQGKTDGFGIGIKNLLTGGGTKVFSYEVIISDPDLAKKCRVTEEEAIDWIVTGRAETNIPIASGSQSSQKVLLNIPIGSPLCTFRLRANVDADGEPYGTGFMDVTLKA